MEEGHFLLPPSSSHSRIYLCVSRYYGNEHTIETEIDRQVLSQILALKSGYLSGERQHVKECLQPYHLGGAPSAMLHT